MLTTLTTLTMTTLTMPAMPTMPTMPISLRLYYQQNVWTDGVCINQKDNDEKGKQVQQMGKCMKMLITRWSSSGNASQRLKLCYPKCCLAMRRVSYTRKVTKE
jgi:hypothetical protein